MPAFGSRKERPACPCIPILPPESALVDFRTETDSEAETTSETSPNLDSALPTATPSVVSTPSLPSSSPLEHVVAPSQPPSSRARGIQVIDQATAADPAKGMADPARAGPGSGFQALGKRSVAFQENKAIESILQSAAYKPAATGTSATGEPDRPSLALPGPSAGCGATGGNSGHLQGKAKAPDAADKPDAQRQLSEYRERLARDMEKREVSTKEEQLPTSSPKRISPIQEEKSASPPPLAPSEPTTTSTESGATIRGAATPSVVARTPSYPFPRMTPPAHLHWAMHAPLTTMSSTSALAEASATPGAFQGLFGPDSLVSDSSTPASAMTFLPPGFTRSAGDLEFPDPNLYDLSLMLSAEPGLEAWWNIVVQIMTDIFMAERVTLAIPADSTDIENVPWGQKATYSASRDDLSMAYMARGSSFVPSSCNDDNSEAWSQRDDSLRQRLNPPWPNLQSRHSFTSMEDSKEGGRPGLARAPSVTPRRPNLLTRSKSSHVAASSPKPEPEGEDESAQAGLNQQALKDHDAHEDAAFERDDEAPSWENRYAGPSNNQAKVLNVLQALDYEADPLIDHNGILRVLERGRVVALTRSYPYLEPQSQGQQDSSKLEPKQEPARKRPAMKTRPESISRQTSVLGPIGPLAKGPQYHPRTARGQAGEKKPGALSIALKMEEGNPPRPPTPEFEEFEQAPPSPWSQSPAPSPAVRADPAENPFFTDTDAMVDEESFNPSQAPQDYSSIAPPEAIGVDNSWTVLHIPLNHTLLSKPNPVFKLDSSALEHKLARGKTGQPSSAAAAGSPERPAKQKYTPIAILSILTPLIPYPSNLRHALSLLGPHLATSFSLCRHFTNLETELNGLQKRRPQTAGFGTVGPDGRPLADPAAFIPLDDTASRASVPCSITSPSEFSAPSRSAANSPGTPSWDPAALGPAMEKRTSASSPVAVGGDGYFGSKPKTASGAGSLGHRARQNSRENLASSERRPSIRKSESRGQLSLDSALPSPTMPEPEAVGRTVDDGTTQPRRVSSREHKEQQKDAVSLLPGAQQKENKDLGSNIQPITGGADLGRSPPPHRHTHLHSYGADFASTFQSLPPSSIIGRGVGQAPVPSRTGSASQNDMMPPSDKLNRLILDSLPAHVFVALSPTGEMAWVNSRFLTYRGITSGELTADPWGTIHPDDREEYLRAWSRCVRTGEQFSRTVRIKRFDGAYRWFYARAVASKDTRGVIRHFLGSYMDIHDQHIAELKAARQEEVEASEAKHRLLANLIPQIIFTATEEEGITFANQQWQLYTGQPFEETLVQGFMDFVHPDDLAKCRIPHDNPPPTTSIPANDEKNHQQGPTPPASKITAPTTAAKTLGGGLDSSGPRGVHHPLPQTSSSSNSSTYELPTANLTELAKKGIVKVAIDGSGRQSYTTEIRLRARSGEYRWHLIRCVEIDNIDFGNGASSYFGSATDINDLKLMETKLKEAMESKGRFLSNMSHEIRTPLIGISGMVSFLQDTPLDEEQRDYTNTIQTSANSLLMIINDILDLSKVDAGMMKLKHDWFHTRSLIEDANELVSTMAIAKRLELNYVVEESVPPWVKGDRVRIRQVLLNVIGNAIKFTSQGEVFSRCRAIVPEDGSLKEDEIMLEFSVVDTGRGFTEKEAELIFKPFSQIDGSSTRQHGGSGLGLVISRQLAELHGGSMVGSAVPGEGSKFTFTAKFGIPTSKDNPGSATTSWPETGTKPTHEAPPLTKQAVISKALHFSPPADSPTNVEPYFASPALISSASSDPSVRSGSSRSHTTNRSSTSSVQVGLRRFSEAARASGQDLSQMKLEMPSERGFTDSALPTPNFSSSSTTTTTTSTAMSGRASAHETDGNAELALDGFRPPMYSILLVCPQSHSREATTNHIEMTLPKGILHQITALGSVEEARAFVGGADPVIFTHIVINLPPEQVMALLDELTSTDMMERVTILILADSVQRQALTRQAAGTRHEAALADGGGGRGRVMYIPKPVKPSRFAAVFDPANERDLSIDRNKTTAQRLVEAEKQSYVETERRMGHRGYKVLLVEDNPVNQKVLKRYLQKVGVDVDMAADGVECTEKVFAHPHGHYALILCDLHMPRKDGYQACREIREWEAERKYTTLPILALSANVMSDVQDKCVAAGFSDYITKPVDFIDLSNALSKFF